MTSRLAAHKLSFHYEDSPVLVDVSVSAESGEVLAIIGPSGTGKTTLLRLLSLFERPDRGTVLLRGQEVWSLSVDERRAQRKQLGMVFQNRSLFSTTVGANATYGLTVRRPWADRVRAWVRALTNERVIPTAAREALATVGMDKRISQPASELSAGEAQRVAFARALAPAPEVLFLDEPTSNLDPRNTALIEEAITNARQQGIAVVLATHDMDQARRVADHVGVLLQGSVIEHGPTSQVFENPADERVRRFVDGELVYKNNLPDDSSPDSKRGHSS
jgi:tungstate transport system ATP-binding protein